MSLLPVATLNISGWKLSRKCNVLLDSGAQMSFIREAVAKEMSLTGKNTNISIVMVGGEEEELDTKVYDLKLHFFRNC